MQQTSQHPAQEMERTTPAEASAPVALNDERTLLRAIFDNLPDAIYVKDRQGRYVLNSPAHLHLLGARAQQEVIGKSDCDFFPAAQARLRLADDEAVMRSGEPAIAYEETVISPGTAEQRCYSTTKVPLRDQSGQIVGLIALSHDITTRKQAQERLRQTTSELQTIFLVFPDLYFRLHRDGVILAFEASAAAELFVPPALFLGRRIQEVLPMPVATLMLEKMAETLRTRKLVSIEYALPMPEGDRWYEARYLPLSDDEVVALVRNITEQRRAQELNRLSEARYRGIVEDQTELICRFLPDCTLTFVNGAYARNFGKTPAELVGRNFKTLVPSAEHAAIDAHLAQLHQKQPLIGYEHQVLTPDGVRWQHWTDRAIFDAEGHIVELQSVGRDITERKENQERLRRAAARAEALVRVAARLNAQLDLRAVAETVCQEAAQALNADGAMVMLYDDATQTLRPQAIYGMPAEFGARITPIPLALFGQGMAVHQSGSLALADTSALPEMPNAVVCAEYGIQVIAGSRMMREGQPVGVVTILNRSRQLTEDELALLRGLADQAASALANARLHDQVQQYTNELEQRVAARTAELERINQQLRAEIAERQRAESAQRASETQLRLIVEQMPATLWTTDADLRLSSTLSAGQAPCLREEGDAAPVESSQVVLPPAIAATEELQTAAYGRALRGESVRLESRHHDRYLDIHLEPLRDPQNQISGVIGLAVDVTEHKQAEEGIRRALAQAEELSALKTQFVSMTSHEFRTPLSAILSSAELLEFYEDEWTLDKKQEHLQRIQNAVMHMTEMLNSLLVLGSVDAGKLISNPQWFDAVALCADMVEEAFVHARSDHRLDLHVEGTPRAVWADERLLREAIGNLLANALKYSLDGGPVDLRLTFAEDRVQIAVSDQGIGVPAEDQERLFEIFHRGRNVGNIAGTGLGLAIVKRAVDLQGGAIQIASAPGAGSTFTIVLPQPPHQEPTP